MAGEDWKDNGDSRMSAPANLPPSACRSDRGPSAPADSRRGGDDGNGIHRIMSFPAALNRLPSSLKDRAKRFEVAMKELKMSATNLVTLNVEPNTCKLCPHRYSCVQNAIYKGLFRSFAAGYAFKAFLTFLAALASGRLGKKHYTLKKIFWGQDALRFGQFIGVMSFIYKAILCSLRRYFKRNDPRFNAIAGFISGLSILLDDPSRRTNVALYCFVRALADLYNNLTYFNIPNGNIYLFSIIQIPVIYSFIKSPGLLSPSYYRWIQKMGNINKEKMRLTTCSRIVDSMHRLPGEKWEPCLFHDHTPSCTIYNTKDWFLGLGRAARIYMPVHFLPTLLFSPAKIFNNPTKFFKQKLLNVLRSAIFLTTYQTNVKSTHCIVRNIIKDDPSATSALAGFMGGLSILLEHPRRRTELTLYVLPRALEACFNYMTKYHGTETAGRLVAKGVPIASVVAFQAAIAIWVTIKAKKEWGKLNSLNKNGLKAVFGSKH